MAYGGGYGGGYSDGSTPTAGIDPYVTVEWSPTTGPLDTPVWVTAAGWRGIQTNRGRQNEVDQIQPGTASVLLDNRDRRFDPLYASGPYFGNVLPMRRFRIRGTQAGVTHDIFQGFVESWDQTYANPNDGIVEVRLVDFFEVLNSAIFSPSPYEVEVRADSPTHWWRLGEPPSASTVTDVIAGAVGTVLGGDLGAASLVAEEPDSAFSLTGVAGQGVAITQADAQLPQGTAVDSTIEFVFMSRTLTPGESYTLFVLQSSVDSGPIAQFVLSDAGGGGFNLKVVGSFGGFSGVPVTTNTVYHVAMSTDALFVNGVDYGAVGSSGPHGFTNAIYIGGPLPGGTGNALDGIIDDVAIYDVDLSAARVAAHAEAALSPWVGDTTGERVDRVLDYLGVAAADRDTDATSTTLQEAELGQSLLDHLFQVNEVEQGLLFVTKDGKVRFRGRHNGFNLPSQATFGDGAGELRYRDVSFDYSKQLIYNVVRRQNRDGLLMEASDQDSIDSFGRRVDNKTGLIADSDLVALDMATYRLSKTKDPVVRVTEIELLPERDPDGLYPQALGREIGEQVTIKRRPQGVGDPISFDARIEGVAHTITPDRWETKFRLSPADTGQYLQLDLSSGPGLGDLQLAY